jgi:hypothetical protein
MKLSKSYIHFFVILAIFLYLLVWCPECTPATITRNNILIASSSFLIIALILTTVKIFFVYGNRKKFIKMLALFFLIFAGVIFTQSINFDAKGYMYGINEYDKVAIASVSLSLVLMIYKIRYY